MSVTTLTAEADPAGQQLQHAAGLTARPRRFVIPPVCLSIADQCLVSGINFLTMIALGRLCGMEELGIYSLAYTVIVVLMALQESLLIAPLTVMLHRLRSSVRQRAYSVATLRQQLLVAVLAAFGVLLLSECAWRVNLAGERSFAFLLLALVTPLWLIKDYGRRACFAVLDTRGPLLIDAASALVQGATIITLGACGYLSAATALAAAGAGHAIGIAFWLLYTRPAFATTARMARQAFRLNWGLGSLACASRFAEMLQAYSLHWLLALVSGPAATGAYAAASAMLALSNPVLMGIGNLLAPETARAYGSGGIAELRKVVMRTTVQVTLITLAFVVFVITFARSLLFYAFGEVEPGQVSVVVFLSIGMLAAMLSFGAENGLRALARPADNFKACLAGWGVSLLVASALVWQWNAPGAAVAALLGNLAASLVRTTLFTRTMVTRLRATA